METPGVFECILHRVKARPVILYLPNKDVRHKKLDSNVGILGNWSLYWTLGSVHKRTAFPQERKRSQQGGEFCAWLQAFSSLTCYVRRLAKFSYVLEHTLFRVFSRIRVPLQSCCTRARRYSYDAGKDVDNHHSRSTALIHLSFK